MELLYDLYQRFAPHVDKIILEMKKHMDLMSKNGSLTSFSMGIAVGTVVLTGLLYWPEASDETESETKVEMSSSEKEATNKNTDDSNSDDTTNQRTIEETIPERKIKAMQKALGLTDDQMNKVLEKSNKQYQSKKNGFILDDDEDDSLEYNSSTNIIQQLNQLIYLGFFIVLVYVINRDYDNAVTRSFKNYFPKEAKILGLV